MSLLIPPIVPSIVRRMRRVFRTRDALFDGDDGAFRSLVNLANVYAEYGSGESTDYVLSRRDIPVISVETSYEWAERVRGRNHSYPNLDLQWIDVGPVGEWGRPIDFARRRNFIHYIEYPWLGPNKPDLVLIDGRFRVSCFLACLLHAKPGCKIVFDDYIGRPHYHLAEEYLDPVDVCGRQAIFEVTDKLDTNLLRTDLERFTYVID